MLAMEILGLFFRNLKVRLNCDNMGVVQIINRISLSSQYVVQLLRHLVLRCLQLNIFLYAVHLTAYALSRFQWHRFWELVPAADQQGVPCPPWLWAIALVSSLGESGGLE